MYYKNSELVEHHINEELSKHNFSQERVEWLNAYLDDCKRREAEMFVRNQDIISSMSAVEAHKYNASTRHTLIRNRTPSSQMET